MWNPSRALLERSNGAGVEGGGAGSLRGVTNGAFPAIAGFVSCSDSGGRSLPPGFQEVQIARALHGNKQSMVRPLRHG